ncbi:MAG: hypothetical protein ABW190_03205 [Rhizobacter sp.]
MNAQPTHRAGGANFPQPIPFVVPVPPAPTRPQGPDGLPPEIEEPPLPGHFPLLGEGVGRSGFTLN